MPRNRARKDENQTEIVEGLRKLGISVAITHQLGKGFPDIVCGYHGKNYMIEIKDGNKSPSQQKLSDDEIVFHDEWRGQIDIANSLDAAVGIIFKKNKR